MKEVLTRTSSPLVTFRFLFLVGAASDPDGKEGVANLTASLLAGGGTKSMNYEDIVQAMYPMATSFNSQVDKEMTVFTGSTHIDNLDRYYGIVSEMLLDPGWHEEDFNRIKEDAINYLKINLRNNNDEELGKEELYNFIYRGTAYGHHSVGTIEALEQLTLTDVKDFYRSNYTYNNFILGLAGGYDEGFIHRIDSDFSKLPRGQESKGRVWPEPESIDGLQMEIIERDTRATAISFGFPIAITRSHPDWVALKLVESYFGQHRSSNSHLYQVMRQVRGLNYGNYAYIEYFPRGMFLTQPDPNLARSSQIFQVWIRPVEPENAHFALRIAMYELKKLVDNGLSAEDFEQTRQFLSKFINVLTKTQSSHLGYDLDSFWYAISDFNRYVREGLSNLTVEKVNDVIKKYLQYQNIKFVAVTKNGEELRRALIENQPSPMNYVSAKPQRVLDEDKIIENLTLNFQPENIKIVPVDEIFQR
ncbi:MAG TPA: pitrilysin family protein [Blastocatellia bacterium]|nr:pitrilysin family protein [Blastocatellia bacterium]